MNRSYRLYWNRSELARSDVFSRDARRRAALRPRARAAAVLGGWLLGSVVASAGPTGGHVTTGSGQITQSGSVTTIDQTSQTLSLTWQSFNVGSQETVVFDQPNASALAINRIESPTASQILGHLDANGLVWLINPNGVLFGKGAQVNVGGLVASTLDLVGDGTGSTAQFRGAGRGSITNQGTITATSGGYVALLGHQVTNEGTITAQLGTVALAAGSAQTLTFSGNHLLHLQVDRSTLDDLVANGQLIRANGGQVIMTAGARDSLLASVVNNTGVVQAETVENHAGTITLLGGGAASTLHVGGTLDASAPHGGNGGSIETSAAQVDIDGAARISAAAAAGKGGQWRVDPTDLTIDSAAATAIDGSLNGGTNVTEQTTASGASGAGQQSSGPGNINVDAALTWTSSASLTLEAFNGINVNAPISGAGTVTMNAAGGNLTLAAGGTVSAQGGMTLTTGANFVNNAGASALAVGSGANWLVYSTNPTLDTTGGLTPSFIQYNAPAGTTPAAGGSGLLYSVVPTLTVTAVTGSVSKVYDGTTTAILAGSNLTVTGLINGDAVVSATGSYASANAGTGLEVASPTTAGALTITNSASVPVYGYGLATPAVSAAIGAITPAPLTATIVADPIKVYDGTTTATLSSANYSLSGFIGAQGATVNQPSSVVYDSAAAGSRTITATLSSPDFTANAGTNLANYQLPTTASGAGTITAAPLDLTGVLANSKTYDGTTVDTLNVANAGIFGVIAPDVGSVALSTSGATGTFASANAGNNIAVTPGGFTLTGSKAADYQLIVPADLTADITPKTLSVTGVIADGKVYDGSTADTLNVGSSALSGVVAGDTGNVSLTTTGTAGTFASANVGSSIAVTASGFGLTGTAAGNYTLAQPGGLAASITPAPLTITLAGNPTRLYNASATAIVPGTDFIITGFVGSQSATVPQNAQAVYATANAGSGITVTATLESSDLAPGSGTLLSNYSIPHTVTGTGTITPVTLTGYITDDPTKVYDGTTAGTLTSADYVLNGFVATDSVTVTQPNGTYASANAGPETITATLTGANFTAGSGTLLSNYVLPSSLSGPGTIQPKTLGGNAINGAIVNDPTKTYDGTATATLTASNFQLTGWVGGDGATVTQTVGQYSSPNAGAQTVTAGLISSDFVPEGSTNLSNYVLPTVVYGTGTINPAPLMVSIVGNPTKVYDGSATAVLSAANYQISGFVSGEGAIIDPASFSSYASKNVGEQTITATLNGSAYTANSGTLLTNYVLATTAAGPGDITPAPLYVTGVAAINKVYDTTTAATLDVSNAVLSGLVSSDAGTVSLTTSTSGTFSQADVGTNLAVTGSGFSISGSGASNYTLQPFTGLHADITPAPLAISGVTANNRVYNGSTAATLNASGASLQGVLGSDTVTLATSGASAAFASPDAGNGIPVAAQGFSLSGAKASDYTLSQPTGLSANITPAPITATITGNPTKAYDGSNSATLTAADYTLTGFVAGQGATVPQSATANYLTANAGIDVALESTLVISDFVAQPGTNLANYLMPTSATGSFGTITPKILNLTGTRVYDTTTSADGTLFGTLAGLNGDTLTVSGAGTLSSANVGVEGFASPGSLTLVASGSALAGNYTLVGGSDSVHITPAMLTVSGTAAAGKIYDGTTVAALSGAMLVGVLGSDGVTLGNDTTGTFATKNVGNGIAVSTSMTLGGADAGNYALVQPSGLSASITPLGITVTATGVTRVYNGSVNDAATLGSSGVIAGDSVTFADTSATFADPNVGNGKTVTVTGISAAGANAGDYTLDNTSATTTANITPYVLSLTGARVYDANTDAAASLFGSNGVLTGAAGETLTLSGTGTLSSKNVSAQQSFASLTGFTLTGNGSALASNYTFTGGADWVDITPAPLTVSGTAAAGKIYDGTTVAALSGAMLVGVLGSDGVTLGNDTTGTFATKNVGNGIAVSTSMTLGGADAGNYALVQPSGLSASITPLGITVTATGVTRVYNGSVNDAATLGSSGVIAGDSVTFADTSATFADPNVGNGKTVTVTGISAAGANAGDYTLDNTSATTTANITPYVLSLTGARVYDANTDAAASLFGSNGVLTGAAGETLTLSGTGTLSSKNVSAQQSFASLTGFTLTGNGSALASNYTFTGGADWVDITPLAIAVSATGANKVYNGTTADPGVALASGGVLAGDVVNFSDSSATFAGKNVGNGITVTVSGITKGGTDAGNYTLSNATAATTADITPAPLTVSGTLAAGKVYDGSTAATLSGTSLVGVIGSDSVTLGNDTTGTFADANAGNGKAVTTAMTIGGPQAGDYTLTQPSGITANITPYVLNLTGARVYDDGTDAAASLFGSNGVLSGVGGQTLTLSGNGTLSSKNVSPQQSFASLTGFTLTGNGSALASNYILAGGTDWVDITPATLTVSGTAAAGKVYDGTTAATLNGATLVGVIGSDSVTLGNDADGTFATRNAGDGIPVGTAMTIGGADAGNYTLSQPSGLIADITPYVLSLTGTRVYDANTDAAATLFGTNSVLTGVNGETLTLSGSGVLASKNVSPQQTFASLSGFTLTGNGSALASNYTLAGGTNWVDITPATLTVSGTAAAGKVYDGTTAATLSGAALVGVLGGDTVSLGNASAGTFASANVGSAIPVTTALTLGGTDAGNYMLVQPSGITANITPYVLSLTGARVYDANTDAAASLFGSNGVLTGAAGETLTLSGTGTLSSKNVSAQQSFASLTGFTLTGNGSALASNYTFTGGADWVDITPLAIAVSATGANKVYNGTTADPGVALASGGVLAGDVVNFSDSSATFAGKNVGNGITVTVSGITKGGTDAGNYTLSNATAATTADITPAPLTVSGTLAAGKVYDGSTAATLSGTSLVGVIGSDSVTLGNDTTGTFADANAGNGKAVTTAMTIGGPQAGDYTLTQPSGITANITPYVLNLTGARVYDDGTDAAASLFGSNGVLSGVGGQTLTLSGNGTLSSKNVSPQQSFASLTGFTLTGNGSALASNYILAGGTDWVDITPATLTVSGTAAAGKVYDGTTAATLNGATLVGVIGSDSVTLGNDADGTFATRNAGDGIPVGTAMTIGGADAGNYTLSQPSGLIADITPKPITVSATGTNRVYNGGTADQVALASGGIVSGDSVSFTDSSASFATPTVGNGKTVTVTGIALGGPTAGNYTMTSDITTTTANITPSEGAQQTSVAVSYLELSPDAVSTPYGMAPSDSPGELTSNRKMVHQSLERNEERRDFEPGLSLQILDGGARMPPSGQ